jgi:zinc transporter, ZIP family
VGEAFFWGLVAGSSLVLGGLVALTGRVQSRVLGLIMAFGAGVLISAVSFELVEEGFTKSHSATAVALGLFAGAAVFFLGDAAIDHLGGANRKSMGGAQASGSYAIVLGIVLDGIPESMVIGLGLVEGGEVRPP